MDLTIKEAAALLGKSPRMVRYMIKAGRIPARKLGQRWVVDKEQLTGVAPGEQQARREKVAAVQQSVEAALDKVTPHSGDGSKRSFYSVRDMHTYAVVTGVIRELEQTMAGCGEAGPALDDAHRELCDFLTLLTDACHQFHSRLRINRLLDARSRGAAALAALLRFNLSRPEPDVSPLADRVEGELLGALRGLLRRAEKREQRRRS